MYSMHCSTTYHVTEGPSVLLLSLTTQVSLLLPEEHDCLTSLQPYYFFSPLLNNSGMDYFIDRLSYINISTCTKKNCLVVLEVSSTFQIFSKYPVLIISQPFKYCLGSFVIL